MITYGLELEGFLVHKETGEAQVVNSAILPADGCGLLVEARGEPNRKIEQAIGSLLGELMRIEKEIQSHEKLQDVFLSLTPIMKISKATRIAARRLNEKRPIAYQNIYKYISHRNTQKELTAGLHLSVTDRIKYVKDKEEFFHNQPWDFVRFFKYLDEKFKEEIKVSKRNPGFYEIKFDGRIEYRSLPCDVNLEKLYSVIKEYNLY